VKVVEVDARVPQCKLTIEPPRTAASVCDARRSCVHAVALSSHAEAFSEFSGAARHVLRVNYHLFELINNDAGRWAPLDQVMRFAAETLIYLVFAVVAVVAGIALYRRRVRSVGLFVATLVLAWAGAATLASVSDQLRPFQSHHVHQLIQHDPGVSLPSDHATAAFAMAFGMYVFLDRRFGALIGVAAVLIGFARVWVGLHYPGDIAAAAVIAAVATLVVWAVAGWTSRIVVQARP
jgi:undecaprenyl-diphosphatase